LLKPAICIKRANIVCQCDTLIRYLLDELCTYEEDLCIMGDFKFMGKGDWLGCEAPCVVCTYTNVQKWMEHDATKD